MIDFIKKLKTLIELKKFFKEKATEGAPLCVMDDIVFKIMLTSDSDDSREALRSLLSACTRREVTKVQILNSELLPAHLEGKRPRFDVKVTFNDGEIADLEMQMDKYSDDLKKRSTQYSAMLQAGSLRKGSKYKEVKRVYQIFFLNDVLFPKSNKFPRRYGYREEQEYDLLTDSSEIIFYELPKLEQRVKEYFANKTGSDLAHETLSAEEKWCIFLKYRHEQQAKLLIDELCYKEEGIMHAEKQVNKISRSFLKYLREMDEIKDEMERRDRLEAARKEGHTLGHAEGHAEGHISGRKKEKIETAKNAFAEGLTPEVVQKITGLDLETIQKLSN